MRSSTYENQVPTFWCKHYQYTKFSSFLFPGKSAFLWDLTGKFHVIDRPWNVICSEIFVAPSWGIRKSPLSPRSRKDLGGVKAGQSGTSCLARRSFSGQGGVTKHLKYFAPLNSVEQGTTCIQNNESKGRRLGARYTYIGTVPPAEAKHSNAESFRLVPQRQLSLALAPWPWKWNQAQVSEHKSWSLLSRCELSLWLSSKCVVVLDFLSETDGHNSDGPAASFDGFRRWSGTWPWTQYNWAHLL